MYNFPSSETAELKQIFSLHYCLQFKYMQMYKIIQMFIIGL